MRSWAGSSLGRSARGHDDDGLDVRAPALAHAPRDVGEVRVALGRRRASVEQEERALRVSQQRVHRGRLVDAHVRRAVAGVRRAAEVHPVAQRRSLADALADGGARDGRAVLVDDGARAVVDGDLARLREHPLLHDLEAREQPGEAVAHLAHDRIAQRDHLRREVRPRQRRRGDGAPLRLVRVEQRRTRRAVHDERELPREVERVLHPGVHALAADGAVDVRRVARDEGSARRGSAGRCAGGCGTGRSSSSRGWRAAGRRARGAGAPRRPPSADRAGHRTMTRQRPPGSGKSAATPSGAR